MRFQRTGFIRPGPVCLVALGALIWLGCGKAPTLVQKYILEYPAPGREGKTKIDEALKVELFAVAQAYNSTAMVYRPTPFKSEAYTYHRWRVNPGNLVSDYLVRDFRSAGLFKAVFSGGRGDPSRFVLEGGVEEFQEVDAPEGWQAVLILNLTLLDTNYQEIPQRVVFQKNYQALEPMPEKTPGGLAQGMSRALEKLSGQIQADVYEAALKRVRGKGKP